MKIEIDTINKTIKILELVELSKLVIQLKKMLGEDWNQYSIRGNDTFYYNPYPQYTPCSNTYNEQGLDNLTLK